jgi:ubiquitin-protein ligase
MTLPRPLLARLHHDLAELLEAPYPGVDVFTDDANIQKFCLVLTPPSGPWKDLSLHFDVVLPNNWVGPSSR